MNAAPSRIVAASSPRLDPITVAIEHTTRWLLDRQKHDGHWVGELQGDTILESEYILLLTFLGRENEDLPGKAARYLREQQRPEGGWSNYPDGPFDLSVSTKAYFALKLTGEDPESPLMCRARDLIREQGGAGRCNSFTRFYLALLGQLPVFELPLGATRDDVVAWLVPLQSFAMSSWTRTIVVPLSIFSACKPVRHLPSERGIAELFIDPPDTPAWPAPPTPELLSWGNFFLGCDWFYKKVEPFLGPLRRYAVRRAAAWMRERCRDSDGLGAIFPPMIYTVIVLRCLGVPDDHPEMQQALRQLEDLVIEEGGSARLQPCFSPVWDTALTLNALSDAGVAGDAPAVERAAYWLLDREVRQEGDWSRTVPSLTPGGWFFEYRNAFYPDTDDTAMVLMALARTGWAKRDRARDAVRRGVDWLLGMQNRDGGWAAFDRNIDQEVLTKVPFADHNAMLDPSCPDITARVLEALGEFGYRVGHRKVDRALRFLHATQTHFGAWPGRWGVNYLYGTWQVLLGLKVVGFDMGSPLVEKAVAWLESVQQVGGGWGESCRSYDDASLAGQGTPTASQTSWALLALLAAGRARTESVRAGVDYLLATQNGAGTWDETPFTGTGFPKVFYLKYHLYSVYFPLMAPARYRCLVFSV